MSLRNIKNLRDFIIYFPLLKSDESYIGAYVKNPIPNKINVAFQEVEDDAMNDDIYEENAQDKNQSQKNIINTNDYSDELTKFLSDVINNENIAYEIFKEYYNNVHKTASIIENDIAVFDAESLYPSIIMSINLTDRFLYIIPEIIAVNYLIMKLFVFCSNLQYDEFINNRNYFNTNFKNFDEYYMQIINHSAGKEFIEKLEMYIKDFGSVLIYDFNSNKYFEFSDAVSFLQFIYNEVECKRRVLNPLGIVYYSYYERVSPIKRLIFELIKKRKYYKELVKQAKDEIESKKYDINQAMFKLLANSIYGYLGFKKSRLFNVLNATSITFTGHIFIKAVSYFVNIYCNSSNNSRK